MNRNKDLIAATGLAFLAAILVWLSVESSLLRLVFGLPLGLYLPGYALQAAAFPGLTPGRPERFLFSLGTSLAVTTLGGFLLDRTIWGLSAGAWTLLLFGITLAASLLAIRRRRREAAARDGWESEPGWFDARQAALIGLAVVVVVLAIWLGSAPTIPQGVEGYSLLWLLPSEGNDPQAVQLGVLSQELNPTSFHLDVRSGGNQLANWDSISLQPGETWNTVLDLPQDFSANAPLEAVLYLSDQPDAAYRTVRLDRSASP